jgi:hypothetical protein
MPAVSKLQTWSLPGFDDKLEDFLWHFPDLNYIEIGGWAEISSSRFRKMIYGRAVSKADWEKTVMIHIARLFTTEIQVRFFYFDVVSSQPTSITS